MKLAGFLIGYLAKLNNEKAAQCTTPEQCFEEYLRLVTKTDPKQLNAAYFKSEEGYLAELVDAREITDVATLSNRLSSVNTSPVNLKAELLVNPVVDTEGELYIYGGSRFRIASHSVTKDTVLSGYPLKYEHIYNAVAPKIFNKLTSADVSAIRTLYNRAADYAVQNSITSVVFMPIKVENKLLAAQVQKIAVDTILFRKDMNFIKKVFISGVE